MSVAQTSFLNYLQDLINQNKLNKNVYDIFIKNTVIKSKYNNNTLKLNFQFLQEHLKTYDIKATPKKLQKRMKNISNDNYQVQEGETLFTYEGYLQMIQTMYPQFNKQLLQVNELLAQYVCQSEGNAIETIGEPQLQDQHKQKYQKCVEENCQNLGIYKNITDRKPRFCNEHKEENMVKKYRVCIHGDCITEARFANIDSTKRLYCAKHKPNESYRNVSVKKTNIQQEELSTNSDESHNSNTSGNLQTNLVQQSI